MMKRKMDNDSEMLNDSGTPMDGVELDSSTNSSISPATSGDINTTSTVNILPTIEPIGTSSIQSTRIAESSTPAYPQASTTLASHTPDDPIDKDLSCSNGWKTPKSNVKSTSNGVEIKIDKPGASSEAMAAKVSGYYSPDQDTCSDVDDDAFQKTIEEFMNKKKLFDQVQLPIQAPHQQQQQPHQQQMQPSSGDKTSNQLNPLRGFGDLFDDDDLD